MRPAPRSGRGTGDNPPNRFERLHYGTPEEEGSDGLPPTRYYRDPARTVLTRNDSPDVPVDVTLNPYRGCEHGCIYCYARPTHEYLGFSAGLDFESRIMVKEDAPELLRGELSSRSWTPQAIGLSGATDPYQPVERVLSLTRRCLQVLRDFRNPVSVTTKSRLVARDADLLRRLADFDAASVLVSITTLEPELAFRLEPRASRPDLRLEAMEELSRAGVPVGVLVAPIIPGLTDHEVPAILEAAKRAGASFAGYVMLRLPLGVKDLFRDWLQRHVPDRAARVLARVRETRDGALNEARFGERMKGTGPYAEQVGSLFEISRARAGLQGREQVLSVAAFRAPGTQPSLFG